MVLRPSIEADAAHSKNGTTAAKHIENVILWFLMKPSTFSTLA